MFKRNNRIPDILVGQDLKLDNLMICKQYARTKINGHKPAQKVYC